MKTRSALLLALCITVGSCVTPSIPIPPPEAARMTFAIDASAGSATWSYQAEPIYAFAVVYIYNRDAGSGVIAMARADGSVGPTAAFPAQLGDNIAVTFETDEVSASTCVVVRDGTPSGLDYCTH